MGVKQAETSTGEMVILTGSTSALGSYLLVSLLGNPDMKHVYCLNRAKDAPSDLRRVIFKLSLPSFRPQFDGLLALIDFTANVAHSAHFLFVSSIRSVMSYRTDFLKTPERWVCDDGAPGPKGYADSICVSESLLEYAKKKLPIRSSVARVDQITGAANIIGLCNKAEWFPSLVISSLHLGYLPSSPGGTFNKIRWVPIDLLAAVLIDLALCKPHGPNTTEHEVPARPHMSIGVFYSLSPHTTKWEDRRQTIANELSSISAKPIEQVPLAVWIRKVREDIENEASSNNGLDEEGLKESLKTNLIAKLHDFYEGVLSGEEKSGNELEITQTLNTVEGYVH